MPAKVDKVKRLAYLMRKEAELNDDCQVFRERHAMRQLRLDTWHANQTRRIQRRRNQLGAQFDKLDGR